MKTLILSNSEKSYSELGVKDKLKDTKMINKISTIQRTKNGNLLIKIEKGEGNFIKMVEALTGLSVDTKISSTEEKN